MQRKPIAWLAKVVIDRGDGTSFSIHQKVLLNIQQAEACQQQWPEQLKTYWNWSGEMFEKYKAEVKIIPLCIYEE